MKIFGFRFGRSATSNEKGEQPSAPATRAFKSRENVTLDNALQLSAVWSAISRWADTISSLPVEWQTYDGKQWIKDETNSLNDLFAYKVNRYQTRIEYLKEIMFNLRGTGNAYSYIDRSGKSVISLLPLSSTQTKVYIDDDGSKVYVYNRNGKYISIPSEDIWHLMTFGNNQVGMSPIEFGYNSIGAGIAADRQTSRVLDNAAKPSGILTLDTDKSLTPEQREDLKRQFRELKEGKDNILMALEAGWDYQTVGLTPTDIQLLESRKFSIQDIGRFFDCPSVLLNDSNSTSGWGNGIAQIVEGWHKLSVWPMVNYIAQSANIHLTQPGKRSITRLNFDFDRLLQLGRKERVEANQKEINSGTMTPNEARLEEGRPLHPDGDELYINTALIPLEQHLAERGQNEIQNTSD